jgi:nucleotide-binding universal stress UspA family protein
MSLKRILALASGGAGDGAALAFAAWVAGRHDGVVDVMPIYPDSAADMIALGMTLGVTLSRDAIDDLTGAERELQERIEAAARHAAQAAGLVFGPGHGSSGMAVLTRGLQPGHALSRHACLADLMVVAHESIRTLPARDLLAQALLGDRTPVLVARGDPDRLSGPVAIAWDGSPQAGRAVRAALPLLAMASSIHVLQCVTGLDREAGDPDIEPLNAYLTLHGIGRGAITLVEGDDEGAALLAAAESPGAGLLVAGAWGHSRLRETVLGGATRSFLRRADGPCLLMAH